MLLIFDLDGTLLNTLDDLAVAANYALNACGFPPRSVEECRQFVGNGVAKLLERSLPAKDYTPENLERMRKAFLTYYDDHLWNYTRPYPEIGEVLNQLQTEGIKLAIASNKYQAATGRLINYFFPQIAFAAVLGQRENVPIKPHPQIVLDILQTANVTKERTLYVGDSAVDMQTAQNAGIKACGVTWGFRARKTLESYHPAYLIDKPGQLLQLIVPHIKNDNGRR